MYVGDVIQRVSRHLQHLELQAQHLEGVAGTQALGDSLDGAIVRTVNHRPVLVA